jgi:hypothetical protein
MDDWLTPRQASERTMLTLEDIRKRMDPNHPDYIPNMRTTTRNGKPRYRIREATLLEWIAAHQVTPADIDPEYEAMRADYDPTQDADSEVETNPSEADDSLDDDDPIRS